MTLVLPEIETTALEAFTASEWEGVDDGIIRREQLGFRIPRLRSNMSLGAEGGWTDDVTGQHGTDLEVIILLAQPTRSFWKDAYQSGSSTPPTCRSLDGLVPVPDSPEVQSKTCAGCPRGAWGSDGSAPDCSMRWEVLLFDTRTKRMTMTAFSGTAIKWFARYMDSFKAAVPSRPPMSVVTRISLKQVENWYEPVFEAVATVNRKQADPLIESREGLRAIWDRSVAEDLETGATSVEPVVDERGDPFGDDPQRPFETAYEATLDGVDEPVDAETVEGEGSTESAMAPAPLPSGGDVDPVEGRIERLTARATALGFLRDDLETIAGLVTVRGSKNLLALNEADEAALSAVLKAVELNEVELVYGAVEGEEAGFIRPSTGDAVSITANLEGGIKITPVDKAAVAEQRLDLKALGAAAGVPTESALLRRARKLAGEMGIEPPLDFSAIAGDVATRLAAELTAAAATKSAS